MRKPSDRAIAVTLAVLFAIIYVAAGAGEVTSYDYYGRLARAFIEGRWWLTDAPAHLNELLSCGDARWCVAYPPMPALLGVPFVLAGAGTALAQGLVSQVAGGASAGLLYSGLRALGAPRPLALTGTVLSALGTTLLYTSADGRAWFAAHAVAVLFLAAAFREAARGGSPVVLGALIGCATLARLPVAAAMPGLALLLARRSERSLWPSLARVVAGGAPFALAYLGYDLLRWGTLADAGYGRLAEGDVFFDHGVFSLLYLPRHLQAIFLEPPELVPGTWLFLKPHYLGMSLFLTTPAFLWLFAGLRRLRRDATVAALALAAGLALVPDVTHATVGFAQFGYRFSLDAQPMLVTLALAGDALSATGWRRWPSPLFVLATVLAVAVNVYALAVVLHLGYIQ